MKRWLTSAMLLWPLLAQAEDAIYMEETVITGNQELPRVLYILPWQDMETELLPQRAFEFESMSVLVPVYPFEQKLEIGFRQSLNDARAKAESANTTQSQTVGSSPE